MSSGSASRQSKRRDRGEQLPSETHTTQTSAAITKTSRSSGAYDRNFAQRMIDNSIYPHGYEHPDGRVPPKPNNRDDLQQMLVSSRQSLSPSRFNEEDFDAFARADEQVSSENRATHKVIPLIQGTVIRDERCVAGDIPFNNLANLMTGKSHSATPDLWHGARPERLPDGARAELGHFIQPSTATTRPIAPNFFVEAKGPSGSTVVLRNQACIDGALGARAMHSLQTYGNEVQSYDSNAYTLSTTYHSGQLRIYAHHIGQPNGPGTKPEYYMTQLNAYALTGDRGTLLKGIAAFRNAVEWTEAQRNAAIEHAKDVYINRQNAGYQGGEEGEGDDEEEDEDEDNETRLDPMLSPFTSHTSYPGGHVRSRGSSTDELAMDSPLPKKKKKA